MITRNGGTTAKRMMDFGKKNAIRILVGFPSGIANKEGQSVAQYAKKNNYGSFTSTDLGRKIPARPFMTDILTNADYIKQRIEFLKDRAKKKDPQKENKQFGALVVAQVKDSITHGNWAPNSPYTLAKKKKRRGNKKYNPKPLIDTGLMRKSVTYIIK